MNRRDALKSVGLIFGTTIIGAEAFLSGCANKSPAFKLTANDLDFLNVLGETILPKTETPGAKEANVANFMNTIVADFYTSEEQNTFLNGIKSVADLCSRKFNTDFVSLDDDKKTALLMDLEKEAKKHYDAKNEGSHFYIMFKQLTIWGYMSSEIVAKNAFIHMPLVEKYIGTIDYRPGNKIIYNDYGRSGSAGQTAMHHIKKN